MRITPDEIKYVAALARLDLAADEVTDMVVQLDRILSYVDKLNELDTKQVAPTTHVLAINNAFREDEVGPSLEQAAALANGPLHNQEAFVVPKII